jgi:hypothetical protein
MYNRIIDFLKQNIIINDFYYRWIGDKGRTMLINGEKWKDKYLKVAKELDDNVILKHLNGEEILAIPVYNRQENCRYMIFDYDGPYPGLFFEKISKKVTSKHACFISKRDRVHFYWFFEKEEPMQRAGILGFREGQKLKQEWINEGYSGYRLDVKPFFGGKNTSVDWQIISLPFYNYKRFDNALLEEQLTIWS